MKHDFFSRSILLFFLIQKEKYVWFPMLSSESTFNKYQTRGTSTQVELIITDTLVFILLLRAKQKKSLVYLRLKRAALTLANKHF